MTQVRPIRLLWNWELDYPRAPVDDFKKCNKCSIANFQNEIGFRTLLAQGLLGVPGNKGKSVTVTLMQCDRETVESHSGAHQASLCPGWEPDPPPPTPTPSSLSFSLGVGWREGCVWHVEGQGYNKDAILVVRIAKGSRRGLGDPVGLPLPWELVGSLPCVCRAWRHSLTTQCPTTQGPAFETPGRGPA